MFDSLFVRYKVAPDDPSLRLENRWYLMFFNSVHVIWLSHDGVFDDKVVDEQPASQAGVNSIKETYDKFSEFLARTITDWRKL